MTELPTPNDGLTDELISAYLDNELSESEREQVDARLRQDPAWRETFEELKRLRDLLGHLPQETPSKRATEQILQRIEALSVQPRGRRSVWKRRTTRVTTAAAGLIAASVALLIVVQAIGPRWQMGTGPEMAASRGVPAVDFQSGRGDPSGSRADVRGLAEPPAEQLLNEGFAPSADTAVADSKRGQASSEPGATTLGIPHGDRDGAELSAPLEDRLRRLERQSPSVQADDEPLREEVDLVVRLRTVPPAWGGWAAATRKTQLADAGGESQTASPQPAPSADDQVALNLQQLAKQPSLPLQPALVEVQRDQLDALLEQLDVLSIESPAGLSGQPRSRQLQPRPSTVPHPSGPPSERAAASVGETDPPSPVTSSLAGRLPRVDSSWFFQTLPGKPELPEARRRDVVQPGRFAYERQQLPLSGTKKMVRVLLIPQPLAIPQQPDAAGKERE